MASEEDELLRPVLAGALHYESLIDGTVDLLDVTRINEALDIQQENQNRLTRAEMARQRVRNGG